MQENITLAPIRNSGYENRTCIETIYFKCARIHGKKKFKHIGERGSKREAGK